MSTGHEEDIQSFDPNEVMAKAYMKKPEEEDARDSTSTAATTENSGPLAFLGLQQKSTDMPSEEKAADNDEKKSEPGDSDKGNNVEKEEDEFSDKVGKGDTGDTGETGDTGSTGDKEEQEKMDES